MEDNESSSGRGGLRKQMVIGEEERIEDCALREEKKV